MKVVWPSEPEFNQAVSDWVAGQIWPGKGKKLPPSVTMGVFDGNVLQAAIAYHDFEREAGVVEFSGAAINKRWITRDVLAEMFGYPFNQLGCQLMVARISPDNTSLHRILKAYGFNFYTIPRLLGRDKDQTIATLTVEQWRANKFKHRK